MLAVILGAGTIIGVTTAQAPRAGAAPGVLITYVVDLGTTRRTATDQFTIGINTSGVGGTTLATTTSTGTGATMTTNTITAFSGTPGTTYTLTDIGAGAPAANLTTYAHQIVCVDANGIQSSTLPRGIYNPVTGATFTALDGTDITCTLTEFWIGSLCTSATAGGIDVYYLDGTSHAVIGMQVNTGSNVLLPAFTFGQPAPGTTIDAFGITPNGTHAYAVAQTPGPGPITIYDYDSATGLTTTRTGPTPVTAGGSFFGGAVAQNGIYYLLDQVGGQVDVYGYDTATNTAIPGRIARLTGVTNVGDLVFDTLGIPYFQDGAILYRTALPLPTTGADTAMAFAVSSGVGPTDINVHYAGMAIDQNGGLWGEASLPSGANWVNGGATTYQGGSSGTGTQVGVLAYLGGPTSYPLTDLASCFTPADLSVQKNVVGRFNPGDQFALSITIPGVTGNPGGYGLLNYNTGQTSGGGTGVQSAPAAVAGPVAFAPAGIDYLISETAMGGADLNNYTVTVSCLDRISGTTRGVSSFVTTSTVASGRVSMADLTGFPAGADIVCTFVNTPRPKITITKVSVGGTAPFTFSGTNGFTTQTITTTASGVGVSGPATQLTAAGLSTTITEAARPGFTLTNITCPGLAAGTYTPFYNSATGGGSVTLSPAATSVGDITFTLTFDNSTGAGPATGIDYTDTLTGPITVSGPTVVSGALVAPAVAVNPMTITGTVAAGATSTVTYMVTVNAGATGTVANFVLPTGTTPPTTCPTGDATCTSHPVSGPHLVVTKSSNPAKGTEVSPGQTITFTLVFDNSAGTAAATGIDYTDTLTGPITQVSAPVATGALIVAATITNPFTITGNVAAGISSTITYTATVNAGATGSVDNFVLPTGMTPPSTCADGDLTCTERGIVDLVITLAYTGTDSELNLLVVLVLLAAGATLLVTARRYRSRLDRR